MTCQPFRTTLVHIDEFQTDEYVAHLECADCACKESLRFPKTDTPVATMMRAFHKAKWSEFNAWVLCPKCTEASTAE